MRALGAALEGSLLGALYQRRRRVPLPPLQIASFRPESLFANGELGTIQYPGNRSTVFTDAAGTVLAMAENSVIARVNDLSGNGAFAARVTANQRPSLVYLNGSYRRVVQYGAVADGTADSLTTTFPDLGSNVTIARSIPGTGAVIQTGQTIAAGNVPATISNTATVIINRALTTQETTDLTRWLRQCSGIEDEYNVAYGPDPDEQLDVFHNSGHAKGPVIVMVHGGGWRTGSKVSPNVVKSKMLRWAPLGFTFVSVEYPKAIGTDPIDQARSVAKALAWVQEHAAGWGCDPSQIVLMGHSAGGHLVALVTASMAIQATAGVRPWLGTVPLDAAGYDLEAVMNTPGHAALYDEPWGTDPAHWQAGSPLHALTTKPVPMLLAVSTIVDGGESDAANAEAFATAVVALGGTATLYETAALSHEDMNATLGDPGPYTDAVLAFFTSLGL